LFQLPKENCWASVFFRIQIVQKSGSTNHTISELWRQCRGSIFLLMYTCCLGSSPRNKSCTIFWCCFLIRQTDKHHIQDTTSWSLRVYLDLRTLATTRLC
jgi:hypothetical protein